MLVPVSNIDSLLNKLAAKCGKPMDRIGLLEMAEIINVRLPDGYKKIRDRYLYDTLYLRLKNAASNGEKTIALEQSILESLSVYLGYRSFRDFQDSDRPTLPRIAAALEGNWYSVVRCNSGLPRLLISPVRISANEHTLSMTLSGPHRTYQGNLRFLAGSFSVNLISNDKVKSIYLAFKIGVSKCPMMLSGVFASVSTAGAPVAGLEILVRSELDYSKMKNGVEPIDKKGERQFDLDAKIINHFVDFSKCYLKVESISLFSTEDLNE